MNAKPIGGKAQQKRANNYFKRGEIFTKKKCNKQAAKSRKKALNSYNLV